MYPNGRNSLYAPNSGRFIRQIILPHRRKNFDGNRILNKLGPMLDITGNTPAIAGPHFKCILFDGKPDPAGYQIPRLLMRMAVDRYLSAFSQKKLGGNHSKFTFPWSGL